MKLKGLQDSLDLDTLAAGVTDLVAIAVDRYRLMNTGRTPPR